ncbi:MAG: VOC family protein [Balneolaceae bacterium]
MFSYTKSFSGYSVDDLEKAKDFYTKKLGLEIREEEGMGFWLLLAKGNHVFLYPKEDHKPATFTVLNFIVDDVDKTMDSLSNKGVEFLHYQDKNLPQDEKGVLRGLEAGMGPDIAWFEDPAGNVLSILQET